MLLLSKSKLFEAFQSKYLTYLYGTESFKHRRELFQFCVSLDHKSLFFPKLSSFCCINPGSFILRVQQSCACGTFDSWIINSDVSYYIALLAKLPTMNDFVLNFYLQKWTY